MAGEYDPRDRPPARRDASVRITLIYMAVGASWIVLSDMIVAHADPDWGAEVASISKGLAYVLVTGLLLYWLMRRSFASLHRLTEELSESERKASQMNAELERRVEERTRELRALNEELSSFSYAVSHDLRSPLRSVNGFSRALEEDYGESLDEQARDYLERIRAATTRMENLIQGLLDLSRASRGVMDMQQVSLSDIARQTLAQLARTHPDRAVDWKVEPHLDVYGDPRLLQNLLENLLENAWKFTAHKERARIRVGSKTVDGARQFFVQDDGAGFEPEASGKLFEPFNRLHSTAEFPGEGIGLATVRRIVRRHGGEVWGEGQLGKGATLTFTLAQGP